MNLCERLNKILNKSVPDKLPWFADLSYWHFSKSQTGKLDKNYLGLEGLIQMHKDLNVGFYLSGFKPIKAIYDGGNIEGISRNFSGYDDMLHIFSHVLGTSAEKKDKDNKHNSLDTRVVIKTPCGDLTETWIYNEKTFSWAPKEYFIKSKNDYKAFKYWIEHTTFSPDFEPIIKTNSILEGIGFTLGLQPRSPFQQLSTTFAGLNKTMELWMDDKDLLDDLIKMMEIKSDFSAEIISDSPVTFIMIPENLSSVMVGKTFFNNYLKNFHQKWYQKIKTKGKYSMIHFDGSLKGLLTEESLTNPTIIEAMTPFPLGDLKVSDFRDYIKTDTIMWGGIPGPFFTDYISDDQFREFVIETIEIMISENRYVLGIGDQIPPDGLIHRVEMISELVEKYGSY